MKVIQLPFGREHKSIKIGKSVKIEILEPVKIKALAGVTQVLNESLDNPIGGKPFNKIFLRGDRVAIVIPDKSRRAYSGPILDVLLSRLNLLGVKKSNITIILARGLHPPHTIEEIKQLVGDTIAETIKIVDHDSAKTTELVFVGTTKRKTRVEINRAAVEADKIIVLSTIQYHYYAGFSGGRKMILPGIAGAESIRQNHQLVFNPPPESGKNPKATLGRLKGNPVHEDMLEASRFLKADFSINLVLNYQKQIEKFFCGDIFKAHQNGCDYFDQTYAVKLKKPADCIIVSTGGYPTDINFIQTHKTIEQAAQGLKTGGSMIVLAECSGGIGSDTFLEWFRYAAPEEIERKLRSYFNVSGHTAMCALIKARRFPIHLLSKLGTDLIKKMHLIPVSDLQETVDRVLAGLPAHSLVLILPEGFSVIPRY